MNNTSLESQIVTRASTDAAFRQQLLDDPKSALAEAFGVWTPPGVDVRVLTEDAHTLYLVLPASPEEPQPEPTELSDAELETVAGGGNTLRPAYNTTGPGSPPPPPQLNPRILPMSAQGRMVQAC